MGKPTIYSGAVDELFGYQLGELPYRSLRFDLQCYQQPRHQAVAQVNYPNHHDYTRVTEMNYLTDEFREDTLVAVEYPMTHIPGQTTPYYPIPRPENETLHKQYMDLAAKEAPNVIVCGRLGDYRYYNMDQAVGGALAIFDKKVAPLFTNA